MSAEKTSVVIFTRHKDTVGDPIRLAAIGLPVKRSITYFGMTLESKLSWKMHIDELV